MFQFLVNWDLSHERLTDFTTLKTRLDYFFNSHLNAANMSGQLYLTVGAFSKWTTFESQLVQLNACKTALVSGGFSWNQFTDLQKGCVIF